MNENDTIETRRFYLYSLTIGDRDMIISIPATDETDALKVLAAISIHPEKWQREKEIETKMGFDTHDISGERRRAPKEWTDPGTGPMYG